MQLCNALTHHFPDIYHKCSQQQVHYLDREKNRLLHFLSFSGFVVWPEWVYLSEKEMFAEHFLCSIFFLALLVYFATPSPKSFHTACKKNTEKTPEGNDFQIS